MDYNRAKEIFDSKGVIDVTYNGDSVWINSLSEDDNMAEIETIDRDQQNKSKLVDINDLSE